MSRRTRDRLETTFFNELKEWSEIKLRILEKYVDAYQRIRGSTQPIIYYIDGFAGPGYFGQDGVTRQDGSPLRIARIAQTIAESNRGYQLRCIFTEVDPNHYNTLRQSLEPFNPVIASARCGSFPELIDDILETIGHHPAIFFLDPFGVKEITVENLLPILKRPDTELLINFNTPRLRKLAGFEDSDAKEAAAKMGLVSRVLGEKDWIYNPHTGLPHDPEWLIQWKTLGSSRKWEEWAVRAYIEMLLKTSPHLRLAVDHPIRETFDSYPKYYLVFTSRSDKAILVMNDILCAEEDDLFEKTEAQQRGLQMMLFPSQRVDEREDTRRRLLDEIHNYGLEHQGITREGLIDDFILHTHFGQFKRKHYRDAIKLLIDQGRVERGAGPVAKAPLRFL